MKALKKKSSENSLPADLSLQETLKDVLQVKRNSTVLNQSGLQEGMGNTGNITYASRFVYVNVYAFKFLSKTHDFRV